MISERNVETILVIPCYNEAARLDVEAFVRALQEQSMLTLLFVDDGSLDDTPAKLEEIARTAGERVRIVTLRENSGKGAAVRFGVLEALRANPTYFGYWDADLSTPLSALADLLEPMADDTVDIVVGSRVKLLGRSIERGWIRHYASRVFATVASVALALPIYDTQCGAKLFRNVPHVSDLFSAPFREPWLFDLEILARWMATRDGNEASCVEVPLKAWRNMEGSRLRRRDLLRVPAGLLRIWRQTGRGM